MARYPPYPLCPVSTHIVMRAGRHARFSSRPSRPVEVQPIVEMETHADKAGLRHRSRRVVR